jgi:hypothetical protein
VCVDDGAMCGRRRCIHDLPSLLGMARRGPHGGTELAVRGIWAGARGSGMWRPEGGAACVRACGMLGLQNVKKRKKEKKFTSSTHAHGDEDEPSHRAWAASACFAARQVCGWPHSQTGVPSLNTTPQFPGQASHEWRWVDDVSVQQAVKGL